jgi:uncharacterized protein YxjI
MLPPPGRARTAAGLEPRPGSNRGRARTATLFAWAGETSYAVHSARANPPNLVPGQKWLGHRFLKMGSVASMHPALSRNLYLVKEHVGMFKAANNYDIVDPATGETVLLCREEQLGLFTRVLRFTDYKRMTPFHVQVRTPSGEPVLSVRRGISFWLSKVKVLDEDGDQVGGFKQKFFSIGGAFQVLDEDDRPLCDLQGKWTSWEYSFKTGSTEFARVTKKWAGLGKELFTTADNYMLEISDDVPPEHPSRQLILGAVMCIDLVLKE